MVRARGARTGVRVRAGVRARVRAAVRARISQDNPCYSLTDII